MDFFERQSHARRKAKLLLFYFIPAVVCMVVMTYAVVAPFLAHRSFADQQQTILLFGRWNVLPRLFLMVAGGVLCIITIGSLYKIHQLAVGGAMLAATLGGTAVSPQTRDPEERQLCDVVEEMAIAAGIPPPEIFILRNEQCINAFVAGHGTSDAAIGVSLGAVKLLTRDELQAMVAHQFSNILNGDMRLNVWLMGLLHGILSIALIGKFAVNVSTGNLGADDCDWGFRSRRNSVNPVLLLIGGLLMVVGSLGYFFGRLIKSGVCKERIFLADAAAVQFTRNNTPLAGALKKTGGLVYGSHIQGIEAEQASHLYFANVLRDPWINFLCTHPPLPVRIRPLDPSFDGTFPFVKSWEARQREASKAQEATSASATPASQRPSSPIPFLPRSGPLAVPMGILLTSAPPTAEHLVYAAGLLSSLPPELQEAARDPFSSCALAYALFVSDDDSSHQQSLEAIAAVADPALLPQTEALLPSVRQLSGGQKLALVNLALPALRRMSREQYARFSATIQQLVENEQSMTLFGFALQRTLRRHLEARFAPRQLPPPQLYAIAAFHDECAVLLSALAWHGSEVESDIQRAFQTGAYLLDFPPNKAIGLLPADQCGLTQVDAALNRFNQATVPVRNLLLRACAAVVAADNTIQEEEAELIRAFADSLGCPLPPLLGRLNPAGEASLSNS